MIALSFGEDAKIGAWVHSRIAHMPTGFKDFSTIGVYRNTELIGGVVYHEFRGNDIQISCASDTRRWLNQASLYSMFAYPFIQLKCDRVTSMTPKNNSHTRKFLENLGFKEEGNIRRGFLRDDCIIYGMLREECRFLGNHHG